MQKYVIDKSTVIGEGGYSRIYKCQDAIGIRGICKVIAKAKTTNDKFLREVNCMQRLAHSPKVVQLYDALEDEDAYYLIMEWCRGGAIQDYTSSHNLYSENTVASIVRGVLRGLAHVHRSGVVHRDIKPGNVLLTDKSPDAEVKLTDFGAALVCESDGLIDVDHMVGTPWYMAPETLRSKIAHASDMWSVGVMTYQLLTGHMPFDGASVQDVWRKLLTTEPKWGDERWEKISLDALMFVQWCLQKDAKDRPSAMEALEHPWLTKTSCEDRFTVTSIELKTVANNSIFDQANSWSVSDMPRIGLGVDCNVSAK